MITYNHAPYIAQSIEAVLAQETNFLVELVIGEDCSTDKTREICKTYKARFPDRIRLLERTENLGMMANFVETLRSCSGKYIALCEGDDYWTDPQKQIEFLETHEDYSGCFHQVAVLGTDGKTSDFDDKTLDVLSFEDLSTRIYICTPSFVFRNSEHIRPSWLVSAPIGDRFMFLLVAELGEIKFFSETMAVYRKHEGGVWTGQNKLGQTMMLISMYKCALKHFPRGRCQFLKRLAQCYREVAIFYYIEGDYTAFRRIFFDCMKLARHYPSKELRSLVRLFLVSQFPIVGKRYRTLPDQERPVR
jgi:glycosyltransferase involved in cell wall biosynthesis